MTFPNWSVAREREHAPRVVEWAETYGLPRDVALGLIALESGFDPNAYRAEPRLNPPDASYGLAQILFGTAKGMGYKGTAAGLYDPETNLIWGLLYFRQMLDRFGDLQTALSAYNGGYRNQTITNPAYVAGVLDRAAYFAQLDTPDNPDTPDEPASPDDDSAGLRMAIGFGAVLLLGFALKRWL